MRTPAITDLVKVMVSKKAPQLPSRDHALRPADRSDWVETTSIRPRERPKASRAPRQLPPSSPNFDAVDSAPAPMPSMASIDSGRQTHAGRVSSNPFDDDFGKYDPGLLVGQLVSRGGGGETGFEDSFTQISKPSTDTVSLT